LSILGSLALGAGGFIGLPGQGSPGAWLGGAWLGETGAGQRRAISSTRALARPIALNTIFPITFPPSERDQAGDDRRQ
jgi:hypothetical protein